MLQWLWFVSNVEPGRIGYGQGPLTRVRQRRHRQLRRAVHICLLEYQPKALREFGELTAFWINERSRVCSASLNEGIEDADVVWVYSQDPLSPHVRRRLLETLKKARAGTPVINHPDVYNSYHEERVFEALAEAGVSVPRTEFTRDDMHETWVVYKAEGRHLAPKYLSRYTGPVAGYRAFEFVDSRDSDGRYERYRAFYVVGVVRPSKAMFSQHWNVYTKNMSHLEYTFEMTSAEVGQVRLIAETLGLQYFAVDYVRRKRDGRPVFIDINVYPTPYSLKESGREPGYYGRWHTFDTRERLGIPEPLGRPIWDIFDEALLSFSREQYPAR